MTDTQRPANTEREMPRVPYGFLDEVYASNRAYEATITRLEAELERLRQQKMVLRGALEIMLEATQPDSTMRVVFYAQDHARVVLAQVAEKEPGE